MGQRTLRIVSDVSPVDDRPHIAQGQDGVERWQFDAFSERDNLGLWVEHGWSVVHRAGWYVGVLSAREGPVVLVVDHHISLPRLSPSLEFRAEGIWAQHVCESPLVHWTLGLEAFGVTLDDPADAAGDQWGSRTAVGLDVEWEASAAAVPDAGGFSQQCLVHGEVLIDDRVVDFEGVGSRQRAWRVDVSRQAPKPATGVLIPVRVEGSAWSMSLGLTLTATGDWSCTRT